MYALPVQREAPKSPIVPDLHNPDTKTGRSSYFLESRVESFLFPEGTYKPPVSPLNRHLRFSPGNSPEGNCTFPYRNLYNHHPGGHGLRLQWYAQTLDKFKKVKIVTRDIVSHNSFALDLNGNHCQGNTFFLNLKDTALDKLNFDRSERDFLYYLLGLLNSNVLEYYQKLISGSLYSKKFRYTTTNLTRWPIPRAPQTSINRIVELVDIIIKEGKSNAEIEGQLNNIVYSIYELGENEIKEIELFLKSNT